jgi:hypothetical protein
MTANIPEYSLFEVTAGVSGRLLADRRRRPYVFTPQQDLPCRAVLALETGNSDKKCHWRVCRTSI